MCHKINYIFSACNCLKKVGWYHCELAKESNLPMGMLDRCERFGESIQHAKIGGPRCGPCEKEYQARKALGIKSEGKGVGVGDGESSSGEEMVGLMGEVEEMDGSGVLVRYVEAGNGEKGKRKVEDKRVLDVEAGRKAIEGERVRVKELEVPALKIPSKDKGKGRAFEVEVKAEGERAVGKEKEKSAKVETKAEKRRRVEAAEALVNLEKGFEKDASS